MFSPKIKKYKESYWIIILKDSDKNLWLNCPRKVRGRDNSNKEKEKKGKRKGNKDKEKKEKERKMRVGVLIPLLFFFAGICLSSSPSSPLSASPSRFSTKQKTLTKALRSLISSSSEGREVEEEEEEEEEESWNEWAVSSTNEIISLGILLVRAPIVNLLPGLVVLSCVGFCCVGLC